MKQDEQIQEISLSEIHLDRETQIRVEVSEETVQRYYEVMIDEATRDLFPPILLFRDPDGRLWLADGHHRVAAAIRRKFASIRAIIRPGTKADAIWEAAKANGKNSLQLGRADVRRTVEMILAVLPDRSNRAIAEVVGCSYEYVRKLRESTDNSLSVERTIGRDGKSRPARRQNTKSPSNSEEDSPEVLSEDQADSLEEDIDYPPGFFRKMEYILLHADEETKNMLKQKDRDADDDFYDAVDEVHDRLTDENESASIEIDETEIYEILAKGSGVPVETLRKIEYIELNADEETKEWLRREGASDDDIEIDAVYERLKSAEDERNAEITNASTVGISRTIQLDDESDPSELARAIVSRLPEKDGDILIPMIAAELFKDGETRLDRTAPGVITYIFNRMTPKAQEELFWIMLTDMVKNNSEVVAEMVSMMKEHVENPSSPTTIE